MKWDVFISHAFEDKDYARELAELLKKAGLDVWFDEFELHVGDSLRRSIDQGLSESAYGIVILSPSFFAKEWTQKELDGLTSRETRSKKVILPIWHNITVQEVAKFSPMLADKLALMSFEGVDKTVNSLLQEIKSESPKTIQKEEKKLSYLEVDLAHTKKLAQDKQIELEAVITQARLVSITDPLTMMNNRRMILRCLQDEVRISKSKKEPLSISMIDIDNFKQINDLHGHIVGDEILRLFASEIQKHLLTPNIIGRYGGEEFLIILPNSDISTASAQAERICQGIRNATFLWEKLIFKITISMGIVEFKENQENWQGVLHRADQALYEAKRNGGDQWAIR